MSASGANFKAAFCARFRCRPEAFETRLLRECLPPYARPLALLVRLRDPDFFDYDRKFLRSLGPLRSTEELELYAEVLRENAPLRIGFLRETLHLRISTRRLRRLGHELLD